MDEGLTRTSRGRDEPLRQLELVVIADARLLRFSLPTEGAVTIGRSSKADICADDESVSRLHAQVEVGPPLLIRDLGSKNGTEVRGVLLDDESAELRVDEPFVIGDVTAIVQRRRDEVVATELSGKAALAEQFSRSIENARRMGEAVALCRVHPKSIDEATQISAALARELRSDDAFLMADGALTALIVKADDDALALTRAGLSAVMAPGGGGSIGIARYPDDGLELDAMVACADIDAGRVSLATVPIVKHPLTEALYEHARKIARGDIAVLILGETGVGKEVLAEAVHRASLRTNGPFIRVSCAALSESVLESELFGHAKGAFRGASDAKLGAFESADGGTLFLDDVGELPAPLQARVLEFLESGSAGRIGEETQRRVDVRVIAANSLGLSESVAEGSFRRDLFYRLSAVVLEVPSIRERKSEVVPLAERFLVTAAARTGRPPPVFSESAARRLIAYDWPGNARELRNVVEHAMLLCESGAIESSHIAFSPGSKSLSVGRESANAERNRIVDALEDCAGNQTRAARLLGISRRTLVKRLDEYGLPRPQKH